MKKYIIIAIDVVIAVYLVLAVIAFNNPKEVITKCTKVDISITDENTYGFLNAKEIKSILEKKGLYPLEKELSKISPRVIEETLVKSPFVSTAQCCKTTDGHVLISVTQRSPLVRIKSIRNEDYYLDENGGVMPNSQYVSDLIIVTGNVTKPFAQRYITILASVIMDNPLWRNQIVQINVQPDHGIELIPRVGDHIVFLGYLPESQSKQQRKTEVADYVSNKLNRLEKFYVHGLDSVGWNKYERIDLQFSNQIICKKRPEFCKPAPKPAVVEVHEADHPEVEAAAGNEHSNVVTDSRQVAQPSEENKPVATPAKTAETKKQETKKAEPKKTEPKNSNEKKKK